MVSARSTRSGEPCPLIIRPAKLHVFSETHKDKSGKNIIVKGEVGSVEMTVNGKWEKFNSNDGWSSGTGSLPDAFSHWTWVHTDGDEVVCDLQGHRGTPDGPSYANRYKNYYLLTDPAIISSDQKWGTTDLGPRGIRNFFRRHQCNDMCRAIGIADQRPCNYAGDGGKRGTTYA